MNDLGRRLLVAAAVAALVSTGACASKPFNVKVQPRVESETLGAPAAAGPLTVRAEPVWDEDWLLENFDANLVLAEVLPVRAEIENPGREPVKVKRLEIEARDGAGREFKLMSPKKARGRVEKYYGLTVRSKAGDRLYKQDFDANALDLERPLAPGERRQGFLFFAIPRGVNGRADVRFSFAF
jgi:hypothetical protein